MGISQGARDQEAMAGLKVHECAVEEGVVILEAVSRGKKIVINHA